MPSAAPLLPAAATWPVVQRRGSAVPGAAEAGLPAAPAGSGKGLPADVRTKMEAAFGADFSAVRIHEGPQAAAMGALAYTQGTDIHFAPGQFDPHSDAGQELLGHELAHVIQQREGRVQAATPQSFGGVLVNSDIMLEREADEQGARAARGERATVSGRGSGVMAKTSQERVAEAAIGQAFEAKKAGIVSEACVQLGTTAVAQVLEAKIRAAAEARASKEAAKLAKAVTDTGTSRGKAAGGSFKDAAKTAAATERASVEATGSSKDTGQQVERLAYEDAKAKGREAAVDAAEEAAEEIAKEVADDKLQVARDNVATAMKSAVEGKVGGLKDALIAALTPATAGAVGAAMSPAVLSDGVKQLIGANVSAEGIKRVVTDAELVKAAKKATERLSKATKAAVEGEVSSEMTGRKGDIKDAAITAAENAAAAKGEQFRKMRGKVKQEVEGGLGPKMKVVAKAVDAMVPDAGDLVEIDALFRIPVPTAPPFFVTLHFVGSAERAGGAGAKNENLVTLKMELLVGAGGNVGVAKLMGEIGGYVESCGAGAEGAFEQISYAIYRRFRESSAIPAGIPNYIWGNGGDTAKGLGISKEDAQRLEAEEWALGVEKRMVDSDLEKDENTGAVTGIGKGAYVEGGLKVGGAADISNGAGKVSAHYQTGRHMRGEDQGGGQYGVPTKEQTNILGNTKEKRGRGVQAINIKGGAKAGSWCTFEGQLVIKWFEMLEGETEREVWVTFDAFAKMNLIKADKWAAFAMSAAAGLGNVLALGRQAYDKYKGQSKDDALPRVGGGVLGALASVEGMVSEASGNATALMGNAGNSLASEATELGLGSQTTARMTVEYRGSSAKAWTLMLYQAKALDVNVEVAQVQGAAHKRLVQLTLLPSPRVEFPGFDLGGD
jgi:hypothetical protein